MFEVEYGIVWDDMLKMGDEKVDSQHKCLFDLLNKLVNQCIDGSNIQKLQETLDFLVNYTVQHFYDEESLQVQHKYPEYRVHKQMHEDFKVVVGDLVERFNKNGSSKALGDDVNKIVVRWLINHIQREDKRIGEHIKGMDSKR